MVVALENVLYCITVVFTHTFKKLKLVIIIEVKDNRFFLQVEGICKCQ